MSPRVLGRFRYAAGVVACALAAACTASTTSAGTSVASGDAVRSSGAASTLSPGTGTGTGTSTAPTAAAPPSAAALSDPSTSPRTVSIVVAGDVLLHEGVVAQARRDAVTHPDGVSNGLNFRP
ncbi:MAG TPA: hypothetical protein PLL54_06450, partial [Dermatophilaceae bacterium]|nr:hypothetical protein [Dermatophilaceae bacterium]